METTTSIPTTNNTIFSTSNDTIVPGTSSQTQGSIMSKLRNVNVSIWVILIVILAILGLNIFTYLAQGTQDVADLFGPIIKKIFDGTAVVAGTAVDVTAEGAKKIVSGTADVLDTGLTEIQNVVPDAAKIKASHQGSPVSNEPGAHGNNQTSPSIEQSSKQSSMDYQANEAESSVHASTGKAGWCYVGIDKGFRTCAEVGVNDTCMSGDIFPSQEICINPTLRT